MRTKKATVVYEKKDGITFATVKIEVSMKKQIEKELSELRGILVV